MWNNGNKVTKWKKIEKFEKLEKLKSCNDQFQEKLKSWTKMDKIVHNLDKTEKLKLGQKWQKKKWKKNWKPEKLKIVQKWKVKMGPNGQSQKLENTKNGYNWNFYKLENWRMIKKYFAKQGF